MKIGSHVGMSGKEMLLGSACANETVQNRKQPYGLAYIHHCGNRLLPDNRTDRKFLGLPGVHNHRL